MVLHYTKTVYSERPTTFKLQYRCTHTIHLIHITNRNTLEIEREREKDRGGEIEGE